MLSNWQHRLFLLVHLERFELSLYRFLAYFLCRWDTGAFMLPYGSIVGVAGIEPAMKSYFDAGSEPTAYTKILLYPYNLRLSKAVESSENVPA